MTWLIFGPLIVAALVVLWRFSHGPFGHAHLSELPGLFWCLLAGKSCRQQARQLMERRQRRDAISDREAMRALAREFPGWHSRVGREGRVEATPCRQCDEAAIRHRYERGATKGQIAADLGLTSHAVRDIARRHPVTDQDAAVLGMLKGATFGPDATVTLPSGRTLDGSEMTETLSERDHRSNLRWGDQTDPAPSKPRGSTRPR